MARAIAFVFLIGTASPLAFALRASSSGCEDNAHIEALQAPGSSNHAHIAVPDAQVTTRVWKTVHIWGYAGTEGAQSFIAFGRKLVQMLAKTHKELELAIHVYTDHIAYINAQQTRYGQVYQRYSPFVVIDQTGGGITKITPTYVGGFAELLLYVWQKYSNVFIEFRKQFPQAFETRTGLVVEDETPCRVQKILEFLEKKHIDGFNMFMSVVENESLLKGTA